jgi:SAM-dependent methyltransferase
MSNIYPTLKTFELEWQKHDLKGNTWGMTQEIRKAHFLKYMNWSESETKGKIVLDAGAGTGQLTCSIATLGCDVIGADLTPSVVRGWKNRKIYAKEFSSNVHIIQANLLQPPFKKNIFDGVHSSGVLHHMPSTYEGFKVLAPLVKPKGSFFVHLYKEGYRDLALLPFVRANWAKADCENLRKFTPKMNKRLLYGLIYIYVVTFYVFYKLAAILRNKKINEVIGNRVTSIFDCLAPSYQWKHNPEEVSNWYKEFDFSEIIDTTTYDVEALGFNLTGIK